MTETLGIVDAGIGNVGSVANLCRRLGTEPVVLGDPDAIASADRLILPGVGAWDYAARRLQETGMAEAMTEQVRAGTPILGICLGMQLLHDSSEEGTLPGLGWIPGAVRRLPAETAIGPVRLPHMSWARIEQTGPHPVLDSLAPDARYYFVHGYAAVPDDARHIIATARYGDTFTAAVANDNVVGTQFHPEKSHRHGKALLAAFLQTETQTQTQAQTLGAR
ncbi:MAG: imidazole glycerol phosphate synthase subunit HisH [Actinomycetota bacterium]